MEGIKDPNAGWYTSLVVAFVVQVVLNVTLVVALFIWQTVTWGRAVQAEREYEKAVQEMRSWVLIEAKNDIRRMLKAELEMQQTSKKDVNHEDG